MSETISGGPSRDQLQSQWDSFSENAAWLEGQKQKAEDAGDQATLERANDAIEANNQSLDAIQREMDKLEKSDDSVKEDIQVPTMEFSEAPEEKSKAYEYTYVTKDGLVHNISADTQEELDKKIQELKDYDQDMTSWR